MGLFDRRRREKAEAEAREQLSGFVRLHRAEQLRTALPQLRTALDRATASLGEHHPMTLRVWALYAQALSQQGEGAEALRELRALANAAPDTEHGRMTRLAALSNLATQLCVAKRYEDAASEARALLDETGRLPAEVRLYPRLSALNSTARALIGLGRPGEAEQTVREALAETASSNQPVGHFQRILTVNLASALSAQDRHNEALEVLSSAEAISDPTAANEGASAIGLARATALLGLGRTAEAAEAAQAGLTSALLAFNESHPRAQRLRTLLTTATNQPDSQGFGVVEEGPVRNGLPDALPVSATARMGWAPLMSWGVEGRRVGVWHSGRRG